MTELPRGEDIEMLNPRQDPGADVSKPTRIRINGSEPVIVNGYASDAGQGSAPWY